MVKMGCFRWRGMSGWIREMGLGFFFFSVLLVSGIKYRYLKMRLGCFGWSHGCVCVTMAVFPETKSTGVCIVGGFRCA